MRQHEFMDVNAAPSMSLYIFACLFVCLCRYFEEDFFFHDLVCHFVHTNLALTFAAFFFGDGRNVCLVVVDISHRIWAPFQINRQQQQQWRAHTHIHLHTHAYNGKYRHSIPNYIPIEDMGFAFCLFFLFFVTCFANLIETIVWFMNFSEWFMTCKNSIFFEFIVNFPCKFVLYANQIWTISRF